MACLLCKDGCCWCGPTTDPVWPKWFTPSKYSKAHQKAVRKGLHPLGFKLRPEGGTCRSCAHRYRVVLSRVYHNCRKVVRTGGLGTDVRLKWAACEHWKEKS